MGNHAKSKFSDARTRKGNSASGPSSGSSPFRSSSSPQRDYHRVLYQQHVERVRAEEQAIAGRDAAGSRRPDTFYHGITRRRTGPRRQNARKAKELLEELALSA